jgi:hypothetical protein
MVDKQHRTQAATGRMLGFAVLIAGLAAPTVAFGHQSAAMPVSDSRLEADLPMMGGVLYAAGPARGDRA